MWRLGAPDLCALMRLECSEPVPSDVHREMVGGCLAAPGSLGSETHRPCL